MKSWSSATFAAGVVSLTLNGCANLTYHINKHYMDEIAKQPHTAHILNYAVTFPRAAQIQDDIPGGLESGIGFDGVLDFEGHHEDKEMTHSAKWRMANAGGEIVFVVKDSAPGELAWKKPWGFTNVVQTPAGTIDVAGLKFTVTHWRGDYKDAATDAKSIYGCDYETRDPAGVFIGLRGVGLGTEAATYKVTESVLKTLQKIPAKIKVVQSPGAKPYNDPTEIIMP